MFARRLGGATAALIVGTAAMIVAPAGTAQASGNPWYDKYLAADAAVGDDYYQSADGAQLGWGESYVLDSFVEVYKLSEDTAWLDRAVTHIDQVVADADDADNDGYLGWSTARYSPIEVDNNGMEVGASGDSTRPDQWVRWQTDSTNAYRTTDAYAGSYAVRINSDGQLWRKMYQELNTYEPNTVYVLRVNAKTNGSAAGGRAYLIDKTVNQILCSIEVTSTTWQYYSTECRTPAVAGRNLQVWIGHTDYRVAGGQAYFDAVKVSGKFPYLVHDGMVGKSIAEFVKLVYQTPSLHDAYLSKAATYRAFLENEIVPRWESSSYIGNTWASHSSSVGTYKQSANFDAFQHGAAWTSLPYNQSLAFTRMLLALNEVNGNSTYLDRATRNGQYFKNALTLSAGAYDWDYAYYSTGSEDVSHANIDVGAARELYERGLVFNRTDMERFAVTIAGKMWNGSTTSPTVKKYVNGTGDLSLSRYLSEWTEFAQWRRALYYVSAEQYRNRTYDNGYDMLMLAHIMKWDPAKLVNQGFELETSFDATYAAQWYRLNSSSATAFRDSANAYSGEYGLTMKSTSGTAQLSYQPWEDWRPSTSYTLTFTGKADGGAAGGVVYVKNESSGQILASKTFTASSWSTMSMTWTSPSAMADDVRVYIGNADPAQAGAGHVDDIAIRPTAETW